MKSQLFGFVVSRIEVLKKLRVAHYNKKYAKQFFNRFRNVDFRSHDLVDTLFILSFETFCEFYEKGSLTKIDWDASTDLRKIRKQIEYLYRWYTHTIKGKRDSYQSKIEFYCNKYDVEEQDLYQYREGSSVNEEVIREITREEQDLCREEELNLISLIKLKNLMWS